MPEPQLWLNPAVHPVYARLICADLRRRGFDEEAILARTRLQWADLHGQNVFLNFDQFRRLVARAVELSQCPSLGLSVGQSTQLSAHGAVGYAAMAANNVGEVLGLMQRYNNLRQRVAYFEVDTHAGLSLVLREDLMAPEIREYLMGHFAAGLIHLLETITGQDLKSRVQIAWPFVRPNWAKAYLDFCSQSTFGSEQLRIDMPPDLLLTPSLAPDPEAYRLALRDCEHQLAQMQKGSLTMRVQQRLLASQSDYPTLEQMAALEHVSARTLIRQLKHEGVTYQMLLDGVREELACWLLIQTDQSIEAIAEQLGYQDTSNFSRTFRRWLGCTPSDFRGSRADPGEKDL